MKGYLKLATAVSLAALPFTIWAGTVDTHGVTGLEPGLWSMHEQGVVHVMGTRHPFEKQLQQCLHKGQGVKATIPSGKGHCTTHERTDHKGVMHWTMACAESGVTMHGKGSVRTSAHAFTSQWQWVSGNPAAPQYVATTDTTIQGHRISARCGAIGH
ncbi:MAG: DUF3617 domain-containing protein [Gammaproteobacteria bacterium]|nr:hypothetical protein [Gammaproteobacteria bacterium]